MSDSLWLHRLQHTRLLCPSLSPGVCLDPCPPSQLGYLTICHPLLLLPSIFPSIRFFSNESRGQSIGVSALASVLLMNNQGWFPLGLIGWISFLSKGISRVFSSTTIQKHQFFIIQHFILSNSHIHKWLLEKPKLWLDGPLLEKQCFCCIIYCLSWP